MNMPSWVNKTVNEHKAVEPKCQRRNQPLGRAALIVEQRDMRREAFLYMFAETNTP